MLKKKQTNAASEADELFNQEEDDSDSLFPSSSGDLFSDAAAPSSKPDPAGPAVTGSQDIPPHNPSVPPPPSVGIETRFEEVYGFLRAFLIDKTEKRVPRDTVWKNLFNVAANRDQLERLVELMPRWRDAKRQFPNYTAAHFATRCSALRCSDLALKVFSDRPKYGLDLSKDAAIITLHDLQASHPIQDCLTFTSLYSIYRLPPVTSNATSTALLLSALFKDGSEESLTLARSMVPSLQTLLANTDPKVTDRPLRPFVIKKRKWLAWTLVNLSGCFKKHGIEHEWLDEFIKASRAAYKKRTL
ncbi:hypothetical protein C8Q74DRAFT_909981 [Fomes fomentarius]|nr:hypothetical protein C8Q74DRAFT_909981 [Fomes fomentarius]